MADANAPWYRDPDMIKALLGAGGAGLETLSQYQQSKANREQEQRLSRAGTLRDLYEGDQAEDFLRERLALEATQMNPFAQLEADQRQAIRAALMSNISNVVGSYDPSTGHGSITGGLDLNRLRDPAVQAFFSPEARLGARTEFDTIRAAVSPNVPIGMLPTGAPAETGRAIPRGATSSMVSATGGIPLGSYVAYGPAGLDAAQAVSDFGRQRYTDLINRRNIERDAIMRALDQDIQGQKKKGGGFLGFLGKVLPFAAAPFTAGLSIPAALAVNAGIGAASSALQGGNPIQGALSGAATGAASRYIPGVVNRFRPRPPTPGRLPVTSGVTRLPGESILYGGR